MANKNRYLIDFIYSLKERIGIGKIMRYKGSRKFISDFTNENDIPNIATVIDIVGTGSIQIPITIDIPQGSPTPQLLPVPAGYNINRFLPKVYTGSTTAIVVWGIITSIDMSNNQLIINTGDDGSGNQIDHAEITFY